MRAALLLALLAGCAHRGGDDSAALRFSENGVEVATLRLSELRARVTPERVTGFDPYYQQVKSWDALPLAPVLALAFPGRSLGALEFTLRASDGYTVPVRGERLLEPGAYLAFADAQGPWAPIGPKRANPGPWYLVWSGERQQDHDAYPRPWALASIAIERFEAVFPRVVPPVQDAVVQRGFALFRAHCLKCHALNQQGGKVGPELNVPRNVTEYRDEAFLRAWVRNPGAFRLSAMPANPQLSDDDVTALLAYLGAMKQAKVDVAAGGSP